MALRTLLATVFVALASMVLSTAPAFAQVSVLPSPNASGNATSAQRSSPAPDTHPSPEARPLPTETSTYRASHEQLGAVSGVALAPVVEQRYVRLPLPSRPAPDSVSQGIRWGRFAGVTSTLAASYTGLFLFERAQWWDGEGSGFHFDSHLNYARNFDKVAHFYAGDVQALINARLFEWSGVSHEDAALWGAVTSLAAQTHVEIHDGFSRTWGFDWYDQAANTLGAGWFYAHDRVEALRRFDVRWSYYPSDVWLDNLEDRKAEGNMFADDYSGHSYWVSMRVYDLLPGALGRYWPKALNVSVGASLHDWSDDSWSDWERPEGPGKDFDAYVAYYVSLDLDWREIIPRGTWLGRTAGDLLNRYHLPFPAVRVWPEPGVHLVFVGQE